MSRARIKAFAKLFLLLGLPVGLLLGLFAAGIYYGHTHRPAILSFEKDWLGMDVVVPPPDLSDKPDKKPGWIGVRVRAISTLSLGAKAVASTAPDGSTEPSRSPPTTPPPVEKVTPPAAETEKITPPVGVEPKLAPTLLDPPLRPAMPMTLTLPERLPLELQTIAREPVTVKVKVWVDGTWAAKAADPFAYVNQTVDWASQVYDAQVGLRLQLQSISLWDNAPPGQNPKLREICGEDKNRDGADLVLVFAGDAFSEKEAIAGSCAIVPQSPRSRQAPHLRSLLFIIGRLLGAPAIGDPGSTAWRRGSWMADVLADDSQPLWIDAISRAAMLRGKQRGPWSTGDDAPATGTATPLDRTDPENHKNPAEGTLGGSKDEGSP
ncbi:MAG TPA: hypothetical protein ENJ18_08970 [Nannocystis exedens]|nr:hypothetical protein [Nannocystis exedens]